MRWLPITLLLPLATALQAQAPASAVRRAVNTITEADVRARVNLIADDSMGGRDTPSPGLERTAAYLAGEFERMGLIPLGDEGGWYQRYGIKVREIDPAGSSVSFVEQGVERVGLPLQRDAVFVMGAPRDTLVSLPIVLAGGGAGQGALDPAMVKDHALVWLAPAAGSALTEGLRAAVEAGAAMLIVSVAVDSVFQTVRPRGGEIVSVDEVGWPPVALVRESAVLAQYPEAADQISAVRSAPEMVTVPVPGWTVSLRTRFRRDEAHRVPNVVGMVRGSDPILRDQYLVITAHFDHVGSRCRGVSDADRICNGADDNASGTTGLLELAEAFATKGAAPRRSVLFVGVSGEERGLWGSEFFAKHPAVPIDRIVANLNMDHLGRNWRDSIVVIGGEHSDLGRVVETVAQEHRELGIAPLPDQWPEERIYFRSDHYNFAKEGVPILFFTNGFHADYHAVSDSPDKIDAEKEARVVRLIFLVGHRIAEQSERPRWNPESYRQIVKRKPAGT